MKILFLTRRFYPDIGGVEKHVYEISKRLVKLGHDVTVVTQSTGKENKIDGIEIIRIGKAPRNTSEKLHVWRWFWEKRSLIKEADLVHAHDVFYWYLPFRFIFPIKKVFTTFHGYEGNDLPTKKAILMHRIAEKLSGGNICVGDYLKKWYGTKPTLVTYGAVDTDRLKLSKKSSKRKKRVIFIGRLEKETGILEYLKTMMLLKKKNINFTLDVFGDGVLRREAKNYSNMHMLEVNFKGFVDNVSELVGKYEYVFTSRYLGTMESFIFKKFVFCIYNNEIKKDCFVMSPFKDYIIMEKDPEMLAYRIIEFVQNPELFDKKIEKAYKWVKTQSWEHLTRQYIKLWNINNE